jgi:hypothetical protein
MASGASTFTLAHILDAVDSFVPGKHLLVTHYSSYHLVSVLFLLGCRDVIFLGSFNADSSCKGCFCLLSHCPCINACVYLDSF